MTGGNGTKGLGIAVDGAGNAYVTGPVGSESPMQAVNAIPGCSPDGYSLAMTTFLIKLDPQGNVVYSTCVPNPVNGIATSVAVDSSGAAYVTGSFGFVTKIDSTPAVVYSTVLASPTGTTTGKSIAVDAAGNAYITGTTGVGFPLVNPISSTGPGAFLAKLNSGGNALVYSTYLTGAGSSVAVDATGTAYATGPGGTTKVDPFGASVLYLNTQVLGIGIAIDSFGGAYVTGTNVVTQLGQNGSFVYAMGISDSNGQERGTAIAVDSNVFGSVYAIGNTFAPDFPSTDGSQCTPDVNNSGCGGDAGFIAQVGPFTAASVSPTSVTFPTQLISTTSPAKRVSLFNKGTAQMTVSGFNITGDFVLSTNQCSKGVKPGTHCDVFVSFKPSMAGTRNGSLTFPGEYRVQAYRHRYANRFSEYQSQRRGKSSEGQLERDWDLNAEALNI